MFKICLKNGRNHCSKLDRQDWFLNLMVPSLIRIYQLRLRG